MNPKLSVARAIGTLMLEDVLRIVTIFVGIVLIGLLGLSWWLTANVSHDGVYYRISGVRIIIALILNALAR